MSTGGGSGAKSGLIGRSSTATTSMGDGSTMSGSGIGDGFGAATTAGSGTTTSGTGSGTGAGAGTSTDVSTKADGSTTAGSCVGRTASQTITAPRQAVASQISRNVSFEPGWRGSSSPGSTFARTARTWPASVTMRSRLPQSGQSISRPNCDRSRSRRGTEHSGHRKPAGCTKPSLDDNPIPSNSTCHNVAPRANHRKDSVLGTPLFLLDFCSLPFQSGTVSPSVKNKQK